MGPSMSIGSIECSCIWNQWGLKYKGFTFENEEEPTAKDDINIHRNAQAASVIISALTPMEFTKVMGIKSAHQIWKLEIIHEGTDLVKVAKGDLLRGQYNLFIRKKDEGPQEVYDRLMEIVNKRRALGTKLDDLEVNKRLLQALQPWNSHVFTLIREKENFNKFATDEVLGRLLVQQDQDQEARRVNALIGNTSPKRKNIALKTKNKKVVVESSSDEELTLLVKRFKKFVKKGGLTKKSYDKGKSRKSKRTCYECGKEGHFIAECPNKNKKEKKKGNFIKKDKGKHHKNNYKGQVHIGLEWNSDSSDSDGGIATMSYGLIPTNTSLFESISDDEKIPMRLTAKAAKGSKMQQGSVSPRRSRGCRDRRC